MGTGEDRAEFGNAAPTRDPFAGIESLRPRASSGWPLENVDPERYFGWHIDPTTGDYRHSDALILTSDPGAFVLAIADGRVAALERDEAGRLWVTVDHGTGIESRSGPLGDALVHVGLAVRRGSSLGLAGGRRLELYTTVDGVAVAPLWLLRQPLTRWPTLVRAAANAAAAEAAQPPPAPSPPAPASDG